MAMEIGCSSWKLTKLNSALLNGVTPSQVGPPVVQEPALLHPVPTNVSKTLRVGERDLRRLTDIDGTIPVGTNAQVGTGASSNVHVVVDSTETGLSIQEDGLGTLVDNVQRLGLSHGHEGCESEGRDERHIC